VDSGACGVLREQGRSDEAGEVFEAGQGSRGKEKDN